MIHVTCRLTAKNRDQLRNPTLGTRVSATFTFFTCDCRSAAKAAKHSTQVFADAKPVGNAAASKRPSAQPPRIDYFDMTD